MHIQAPVKIQKFHPADLKKESCCLAFHASHGTYHTLRSSLLHLNLYLHVWDVQTLWVRKVNVGCTLSTGNMKSERQRDEMRNTPKIKRGLIGKDKNWGENQSVSLGEMQRPIKKCIKVSCMCVMQMKRFFSAIRGNERGYRWCHEPSS